MANLAMITFNTTATAQTGRQDPGYVAKAYLKAELETMLADDEDGLAAEFENLQL